MLKNITISLLAMLLSSTIFAAANNSQTSFDWRNITADNPYSLPAGNYVTSVKNQAAVKLPCAYTLPEKITLPNGKVLPKGTILPAGTVIPDDVDTCWAFATVAVTESHFHIYNQIPVTPDTELNLSEQYLISAGHYSICDDQGKVVKPHGYAFPGDDCGGDPGNAFKFLQKIGTVTEQQLPYYADLYNQAVELGIWPVENPSPVYKISNYSEIKNLTINKVKKELREKGPLAAMIRVYDQPLRTPESTSLYSTGDWYWKETQYKAPAYKTGPDGEPINWDGHIVTIVGYQDSQADNLKDFGGGYWIVKNSYGKDWGNDIGAATDTKYNGYGLIPYNALLKDGYILEESGNINVIE